MTLPIQQVQAGGFMPELGIQRWGCYEQDGVRGMRAGLRPCPQPLNHFGTVQRRQLAKSLLL